jgi:tRNA(Arg) A34 adenosine deaminase TadA
MCLGAIYWARIDKVYYANTKTDARNIGFDDSFIYDEIAVPINQRQIKFEQLLPDEGIKAFQKWQSKDDKIAY